MSRFRYFVVKEGTNWEIRFDGQKLKYVYKTQADAMAVARLTAQKNWLEKTMPSEVTIQGDDGQWRASDTYGNDPFPPRG